MTGPRGADRLRLTVEGVEALSVDLGPDDAPLPSDLAGSRDVLVTPLPLSAADRAEGVHRYAVSVAGWELVVAADSLARSMLRERARQGSEGVRGHGPAVVRAPLPGRVVRIWVVEGDTVEAGQRLVAIEAMKMENEVRAPRAGIIGPLGATVGRSVELGDELLTVR